MLQHFKELTPESYSIIQHYVNLRPTYIAERQFVNQYIWSGYYQTMYTTTEHALFYKIKLYNDDGCFMPFCKEEDIISSFIEIKDYFNHVLHKPLKMYLVDETFTNIIKQHPEFSESFDFVDFRDGYDYVYEAEKLRTLSGRKMHKKKNHLNNFLRNYEGRYEYRHLCCKNMEEVKRFHLEWLEKRDSTAANNKNNSIEKEEEGIFRLLNQCKAIDYRCGGVYVDDQLKAYSIGSYDPAIECAYIHIEKADSEINGLYNFINQQFLLHEFPEAKIVNREDDLGQEGLRKSKLSYSPLRLEAKYHIIQK